MAPASLVPSEFPWKRGSRPTWKDRPSTSRSRQLTALKQTCFLFIYPFPFLLFFSLLPAVCHFRWLDWASFLQEISYFILVCLKTKRTIFPSAAFICLLTCFSFSFVDGRFVFGCSTWRQCWGRIEASQRFHLWRFRFGVLSTDSFLAFPSLPSSFLFLLFCFFFSSRSIFDRWRRRSAEVASLFEPIDSVTQAHTDTFWQRHTHRHRQDRQTDRHSVSNVMLERPGMRRSKVSSELKERASLSRSLALSFFHSLIHSFSHSPLVLSLLVVSVLGHW